MSGSLSSRPLALVLGPEIIARQVARQLEAEGYDPLREGEASLGRLPRFPSDPDSPGKLRDLLHRFSDLAHERTAAPERACVHPGVSLWAERPELPVYGQEFGLNMICPSSRVLSLFSNKLNLLTEADRLGIPTLVIDFEPLHGLGEIQRLIARRKLRFPILLKGTRGSGGFGLYAIHDAEEIERKLPFWIEQLQSLMGEVILFAERYLEGARHVAVPFSRTRRGQIELFAHVDASLQARSRKLIELSPFDAAGPDPEVERRLTEYTRSVVESCDYVGVGVLEFLVDGDRVYLIDGLARLNTGFSLWERVSGTSAVAWQLAAYELDRASRQPAVRRPPPGTTSCLVRIYAEDPLLQLPQPGLVQELSPDREWTWPDATAGLELSVEAGTELKPSDYGLLGLLSATAGSRARALEAARSALGQLWIAGSLRTNERFLSELLGHPWAREGVVHAGFVDEEFLPATLPPPEIHGLFASVCALALEETERRATRWVVSDRWQEAKPAELRWKNGPAFFTGDGIAGRGVTGELEGGLRVCVTPITSAGAGRGRFQARIGPWTLSVRAAPLAGARAKAGGSGAQGSPSNRVLALVSGQVRAVFYREGSVVQAHEPLLTLESLGMIIPHALPVDVRVTRWSVRADDEVRAGEELAEFERLS